MARNGVMTVNSADAAGLTRTAKAAMGLHRYGELQLLRWLRWLGRNDLALLAHLAVLVIAGMTWDY